MACGVNSLCRLLALFAGVRALGPDAVTSAPKGPAAGGESEELLPQPPTVAAQMTIAATVSWFVIRISFPPGR
jgi:hypothetical protein